MKILKKKGKKGAVTSVGGIFLIIVGLLVAGALVMPGLLEVMAPTTTSTVSTDETNNANVRISDFTSTLGEVDTSDNLIKINDDDLDATGNNFSVEISAVRDDTLRDTDGSGYIFEVLSMPIREYNSHNSSVDDQLSFIKQDGNDYMYSVAGMNYEDLPYRFELKQGEVQTITAEITLSDLEDFQNIVENQYDSHTFDILNLEGETISVRYTKIVE